MGPGVGLFGAPSRCHERFCAPLDKRKVNIAKAISPFGRIEGKVSRILCLYKLARSAPKQHKLELSDSANFKFGIGTGIPE